MDHVAELRRFNRSFTQRIGVLDDSFLGTGRPLGASRALFEIGLDGLGVTELRSRLGIESGYASRLLRQLEAEHLVAIVADPDDGRRRRVELTPAGRREWTRLDRRSDELAERLLAGLGGAQRTELGDCLRRVERLLAVGSITFAVVDPFDHRVLTALRRYADELQHRFPDGFTGAPDVTSGLAAFADPTGAFMIATVGDDAVACGGLLALDDDTAELKRMWVAPDWRGVGLGRRALESLEARAGTLGRRRVVLDTNRTLTEAISLYESAGYVPVERYNDNPDAQAWFAKDLDRGEPAAPIPSTS